MSSLFAVRLSHAGSRAGSRPASRAFSPSDFFNFDNEGNDNVVDPPSTPCRTKHRSKRSHQKEKAAAKTPASSPRMVSVCLTLLDTSLTS